MNLSLKLNICSDEIMVKIFKHNISFVDDVKKFAGYQIFPKYQAGGKINRPGQLVPDP